MERTRVELATVDARELIERLERLRSADRPAVLAFDGDGTLWSGDVSENVFGHAVHANLLKSEAAEALRETAERSGISSSGSPSKIAKELFSAYIAGTFGEREVCEVMTWCYAGFTPAELAELSREVLFEHDLGSRLNRRLEPIIEYARETGLRCIVVSASPQPIVEIAAALWGFSPSEIVGARAAVDGGRIAPKLVGRVPYAEDKCPAAQGLIGRADWLASFGDNVFDVEMLCAARIGVAVDPKLELRMRLPALPSVVLLG